MKKPELLAPVGNTESFFAALQAGADAIYLGLPEFNARVRAGNFTRQMLQLAVKLAHQKNVKVYIALNILIKNKELGSLIGILSFLEWLGVDAIIIQDWGVYTISHSYFPKLVLHASTQMGNHNSIGVNFGRSKGIARTVIARELTIGELEAISRKSKGELEVFVHGALCYSFSGMCLFSSYMGGQGANRGICKQGCRRIYHDGNEEHALFSLKDNEQIRNLRQIMDLGVHSLKIEGRMKSADYVFQVCKAYRLAIDHPDEINRAAQLLELDMGREKTGYFLAGNVSDSITVDASTGILIGRINSVERSAIAFNSSMKLEAGYRLRIRNAKDDQPLYIKIENFKNNGSEYRVTTDQTDKIVVGNDVLLVRLKTQPFPSRLGNTTGLPEFKNNHQLESNILKKLKSKPPSLLKASLWLRIGSPDWISKLRFDDYDAIILSFNRSEWNNSAAFMSKFEQIKSKIWIEIPRFIAEGQLEFYNRLTRQMYENGFRQFFVSHLSQKLLLPQGSIVSSNENVYVLNDAAAKCVQDETMTDFIYPLENDLENLLSMTHKQGIVPLYFYPELFFSRMPVGLQNENQVFADENNKKFRKQVKDGITVVYPNLPVALFHYKPNLLKAGFSRFLIDYTGEELNSNVVKRILRKYFDNESIPASTNFNFKLGLK